ncbi:MAG: hypothetical protein FWC11_06665 [Firmicutes bacterium]|nr:hypothetical protein [Bacillota bacterium]MCL2256510.1 hypothetical protein [Bacillota bacterium]
METHWIIIIVLGSIVIVVGGIVICFFARFHNRLGKIEKGMSQKEVVELIGHPDDITKAVDGVETYIWKKQYVRGFPSVYTVVFKDKKVVSKCSD